MKGIPLGAGEYQNRNILIRGVGLPLRMSKHDHRSVSNYNLFVVGWRILLVLQLQNRSRIPAPSGWQEKRQAVSRIPVTKRQARRPVGDIRGIAAGDQ